MALCIEWWSTVRFLHIPLCDILTFFHFFLNVEKCLRHAIAHPKKMPLSVNHAYFIVFSIANGGFQRNEATPFYHPFIHIYRYSIDIYRYSHGTSSQPGESPGAAGGLGSCGDVFLAEKIPTWIREQIFPQGTEGWGRRDWTLRSYNVEWSIFMGSIIIYIYMYGYSYINGHICIMINVY